jgi:tetratricopeptide (TPR) repeat protein
LSLVFSLCPAFSETAVVINKSAEKNSESKNQLKSAQKSMVNFYKNNDDLSFELARSQISKILRNNPENINARVMLASLFQKKTDILADSLIKEGSSKVQDYFQIGNVMLSSRRFEEAIACYDKVIEKYPKWACPMRHKGEALINLDRNEEAVNVLKACLKVREKHFDAYVFLARALIKCQNYEEALLTVNKAVKMFTPDDPCGEYGLPEAIMQDCNKLYYQIYTKMNNPEKAEKYKN